VRSGRYIARAAVLAIGCALLWLSTSATLAIVLGDKDPILARSLGYASAKGDATLALSTITSGGTSPAKIAEARQLAQRALRREPVNVTATVTLGLIAALEKKDALSRQLFGYSERISRRDSATQLWIIEDEVAHGNVAGALVHYDRTMRVSPGLRRTLVPILVQASGDPDIIEPLAKIIGQRPNWWPDALGPIIAGGPSPVTTLPVLLRHLQLRKDHDQERAFLIASLRRLSGAGAYAQAYALYQQAGSVHGLDMVRNGSFEQENQLPPFDWDLHSDAGLEATVQQRDGQRGKALFLSAEEGQMGAFARQLLLLKPGRYEFTAASGNVAGDLERPGIRIDCAGSPAAILDIRLPVSNGGGQRVVSKFDVPASACPAQWLSIVSAGGLEEDASPWIDGIIIRLAR
jgi:hypothetical protein